MSLLKKIDSRLSFEWFVVLGFFLAGLFRLVGVVPIADFVDIWSSAYLVLGAGMVLINVFRAFRPGTLVFSWGMLGTGCLFFIFTGPWWIYIFAAVGCWYKIRFLASLPPAVTDGD